MLWSGWCAQRPLLHSCPSAWLETINPTPPFPHTALLRDSTGRQAVGQLPDDFNVKMCWTFTGHRTLLSEPNGPPWSHMLTPSHPSCSLLQAGCGLAGKHWDFHPTPPFPVELLIPDADVTIWELAEKSQQRTEHPQRESQCLASPDKYFWEASFDVCLPCAHLKNEVIMKWLGAVMGASSSLQASSFSAVSPVRSFPTSSLKKEEATGESVPGDVLCVIFLKMGHFRVSSVQIS